MKIIFPDQITAVVAGTEASGYPDDNVLDDSPKKVWRATGTTDTIKLTVSAGSNALALHGLDLTEFDLTIKDVTETTTLVALTNYTVDEDCYWVTYATQSTAIKLILDVTAATACEIGVARAGLAHDIPGPGKDLQQTSIDYSIVKKMNDGSMYYRKRDVVRRFSGSAMVDRDTDFNTLFATIKKEAGPRPMSVFFNPDLSTFQYLVFGSFLEMGAGHKYPTKSAAEFVFEEVV